MSLVDNELSSQNAAAIKAEKPDPLDPFAGFQFVPSKCKWKSFMPYSNFSNLQLEAKDTGNIEDLGTHK